MPEIRHSPYRFESHRRCDMEVSVNKRAVALYMRLSREDGKAGGDGFKRDESNSIGNQRKLLLDF